ncbi:hypothetical protein pEaSNUABM42_00189 [Erwinia phage pEa_SNUABM_42]|nr:hypothetical protein pEaSNUABM43_00190 [Erwinia phage pEa_SNUABM_43]QVW55506.1 hypothetical protein pEaSNUABM42_00189 [Erwinia phage pEa_SNUABM_42]
MKNKMIVKQMNSGEIMFNYGKEFPTLQKLPITGEYIVFEDDHKPAVIFKYAMMAGSRVFLLESIFTTKSELPARELCAFCPGGPKQFSVIFVLPLSLTVEDKDPSGSICAPDGENGYKGISDALILTDAHHFSNDDIDKLLKGAEGRNVAVCYGNDVHRTKALRHLAEHHNYCVAKHIYSF